MGCLYLVIEGQPCLVGSVDRGLIENRSFELLDRMTKKRARKYNISMRSAARRGNISFARTGRIGQWDEHELGSE